MTLMDQSDPGPREPVELPLELVYDGPDYQGEMPVAELASVLEGVSEYTQAMIASGSLSKATKVVPKVTAFASGSFDIQFVIEVLGVTRDSLAVAGILGGGFAFWWKNMRRRVIDFTHDAQRGTVKVTMADGETQEWTEAEWRMYNNKRARAAVRKMIRPLRETATRMHVIEPDSTTEIKAEDAGRFEELPAEGPEVVRFTVSATPDTVRFDPTKAWGLESKDHGRFTATIEDREFLRGIELNRIRVGKYDTFVLAVRSESDPLSDSRPKYFVERVVDHQAGGEQHELPSGEGT